MVKHLGFQKHSDLYWQKDLRSAIPRLREIRLPKVRSMRMGIQKDFPTRLEIHSLTAILKEKPRLRVRHLRLGKYLEIRSRLGKQKQREIRLGLRWPRGLRWPKDLCLAKRW